MLDIRNLIVMEDIPKDLLINWDQTAVKIVPSSLEKHNTKHVEIAVNDDKCQITALFNCTAADSFLPIQLVYKGITKRSFPNNVVL